MPTTIRPLGRSWRLCGIVGFLFLLPATRSFCAQTVTSDPDPGITGEGFVDYVGNYGEVFKLRGGWQIQASMHDGAEVINHFPSSRISFSDSLEPFNPKPSDFVPENFTRYALIQLVILPRASASPRSLEELKALKIKDLLSSHVGFQVLDHPNFGGLYGDWSKGTFEIWISTPYKLSQLYTASDSYLCILTSGRDTPPSTVISRHYEWVRSSLRDWVAPPTQLYKLLEPRPLTMRQTWAQGTSLHILAKSGVWITWALVSGISCLLAGFLGMKRRWEWLRRASLAWLIFSNAGALLGGLVGLVFWPFAWPSQHLPIPAAVTCLFMPLLVLISRRFHGECARRSALVGVATWAVIAFGILCYLGLAMEWGTDFMPVVPVDTAIAAFVFYGVGGIIFGLLDRPSNTTAGTQALIALACLAFLSPKALAQSDSVLIRKATPNRIDSGIDFNARANMAARGETEESYKPAARETLSKMRILYKFQRVEIKGILIKEDTNDVLPDMFDKQVEPSHLGDINSTPVHVPAWIKDLQDLHKDASQAITKAALQTVRDLQGQEVNEIVAHSWGTEIVYNAILSGAIKPPRRLIVAGMPDRDFEKWKALSKYTGTEVVVYSDSHDPAALAARLLGYIRDGLSKAGLAQSGSVEDIVIRNPGQFEQQWEKACQTMSCNPHDRKPLPPPITQPIKASRTHVSNITGP